MTSPTVWREAARLFDVLHELDPAERARQLEREAVPDPVRDWLESLLQAHDDDRTLIVDRRVDELVQGLLAEPESRVDVADFAGQRFGAWRAGDLLGRGGMGVVLHGERADGRFDKHVAIKLLDPGAVSAAERERFSEELKLLAAIEHPGIARLLDGGVRDDGVAYLVMEYIDGVPIDEHCRRHDAPLAARLELFGQVADAVSWCHGAMVIHGDIKPANVLVDTAGRARLLDFGIATRLGGASRGDAHGVRWCSPAYASPERLAGSAPAVADDVFALGALLYQLLSDMRIRSAVALTRLVDTGSRVELPPIPSLVEQARRAGRPRRWLRAISGDLEAVCARALEESPRRRYRSVDALVDDLHRWRVHRPVRARDGGVPYRLACWLRRYRSAALAGGLATIALLGGLAASLWQADIAQRQAERAESALARADAINEFVIGLFEADIPDVAPDEMPTTRQLVDQGITLALDPQAGPPGLRADMLLTLAEILMASRGTIGEAAELLEQAEELAQTASTVDIERRIKAQVLRADIARWRNDFDAADTEIARALDLLEQHRPDSLLRLEMLRDRARVLMHRERHARARPLLEQVRREALGRPEADELLLRVMQDLAIVNGLLGDREAARAQMLEVLDRKRAMGLSPQRQTTTLVNLAGLEKDAGNFERAGEHYRRVIDLLEPLADLPIQQRAVALQGLSDLHLLRGEFETATTWLRDSAKEWARSLEIADPDDDWFIHYYSGQILAQSGRFDAAIAAWARALGRMEASPEVPPHRIALVHAWRAALQCRMDRPRAGRESLARAEAGMRSLDAAPLAEARAECALAVGDGGARPGLVTPELIARASVSVDDAVDTARLEWLRGRLLARAGREQEAGTQFDSARQRLDRAGVLPNHPLRQWIAESRAELATVAATGRAD